MTSGAGPPDSGSGGTDALVPVVYDELRRIAAHLIARERPGATLQPTMLVHEAWLRLGGEGEWQSTRHFLNAAALAMRRLLVDRARAAKADKRGGGVRPAPDGLDAIDIPAARDWRPEEVEALEAALRALEAHNERWAQVVHLRFFLGLTLEQAADALAISRTTVKEDWAFARAWLGVAVRRARGESA